MPEPKSNTLKPPALPPGSKTGLQTGEGKATGRMSSDEEAFNRLSADTGLDKIREGRAQEESREGSEPKVETSEQEAESETEATAEAQPVSNENDPFGLGVNHEENKINEGDGDKETETEQEEQPSEEEHEEEAAPKDEKPKTGKDLRSQLERYTAQAKSLAKEKETLTRRLSELEAQVKDAPNSKVLSEAVAERDKKIAELEKRITYLDYTQSSEFAEKYSKPYEAKLKDAFKELSSLDKEDGSKLSESEIENILFGGEKEAYRQIEKDFTGGDARLAERLIQEVYSVAKDKEKALKSAQTDAQERAKQQNAQRIQAREAYRSAVKAHQDQIPTKFPDVYKVDPKDKELSQRLEQGYQLVDLVFGGKEKPSPEQLARAEAEIYHRAGAMPAMYARALRAEKALADARKELSRFKKSAPGRGEVGAEETNGSQSRTAEIGSQEWIGQGLRASQRAVKG